MNHQLGLLLLGVLASTASAAADRAIVVPAKAAMSWGFMTNSTKVQPSRQLGVGFWQRASGAKPGVGDVFVSAMEYQLPEAAPSRVRSATFQFSGKPSQCVGAEPVVIEIYAYPGDGRLDVSDASAGSRIAQMQADCNDNAAFSRPIDVTQIVRQASVASGIRHVGFNMRKANNRQGPGLFNLSAGRLTVVIADQDIDKRAVGHAPMAAPTPGVARPVAATAQTTTVPPRLVTSNRGSKIDEARR
jgi:hypothetical protein